MANAAPPDYKLTAQLILLQNFKEKRLMLYPSPQAIVLYQKKLRTITPNFSTAIALAGGENGRGNCTRWKQTIWQEL